MEEILAKSVSVMEHEKLKKRYQQLSNEKLILSSRCSRLLAASGIDVGDGDEIAIRKIEVLAARSKGMGRDINVSLSVIRVEMTRRETAG